MSGVTRESELSLQVRTANKFRSQLSSLLKRSDYCGKALRKLEKNTERKWKKHWKKSSFVLLCLLCLYIHANEESILLSGLLLSRTWLDRIWGLSKSGVQRSLGKRDHLWMRQEQSQGQSSATPRLDIQGVS